MTFLDVCKTIRKTMSKNHQLAMEPLVKRIKSDQSGLLEMCEARDQSTPKCRRVFFVRVKRPSRSRTGADQKAQY